MTRNDVPLNDTLWRQALLDREAARTAQEEARAELADMLHEAQGDALQTPRRWKRWHPTGRGWGWPCKFDEPYCPHNPPCQRPR